jgi:PAS domain S-box-containing protein
LRNAPGGRERVSGDWPVERPQRGETVVNEEIDIVRPDGFPRTLMVNSRPLQGSAGQTSVIGTYSDVTSLRAAQKALRDSEARLRRLFDSPIIGVVSGNGDVALEANDGFLRMLGYSREDLEAGAIRFSAVTPPEFQAVDARIAEQLAARGFSDPVTKELVAVDGRRIPVMVGATAFEASQPSRWISWVLDLSEHRRLEERLRQAAKAESIGLLAGGVAHDFNNLLTIIMGNASLAHAMLPDGGPGRLQLENLLRAGERATDLTRQLLAYAGKGRFIVQPADVSRVIHDITRLFLASAPKDVAIVLDLPSGLPSVNVDTTQIQQLVMNLVLNAIESIGDRPGSVRVAASSVVVDGQFLQSADLVAEMAPGPCIRIEVTDDGCGMDMDTRQRIFDPFFTTKFTGRGLGLAAAAGIVQAHRGGMIVRSAPGQGSVFQVFLPAVASASGASQIPAISEEAVSAGSLAT